MKKTMGKQAVTVLVGPYRGCRGFVSTPPRDAQSEKPKDPRRNTENK